MSKKQEDLLEFPSRLGKTRYEKKLSQAQLAEQAELSTTSVCDYESGKKRPSLLSAVRIAEALDVSLDYLCDVGPGSYRRNPALAWFEAIKALKIEIKNVGDGEVVLAFKDIMDAQDGRRISGQEIKRFFEAYQGFQMVEAAYSKIPDGAEIIDMVKEYLLQRFKDFPDLPPYDVVRGKEG